LNDKFGFEAAGHLTEIADVFGQKRGLKISILRIKKGGHDARRPENNLKP
jgi:L-amino acid N-acyltransferase YncA